VGKGFEPDQLIGGCLKMRQTGGGDSAMVGYVVDCTHSERTVKKTRRMIIIRLLNFLIKLNASM
jgi:hypothetical protein